MDSWSEEEKTEGIIVTKGSCGVLLVPNEEEKQKVEQWQTEVHQPWSGYWAQCIICLFFCSSISQINQVLTIQKICQGTIFLYFDIF
jgi:hypothetical protein